MAKPRAHLTHAPIAEAILDFRVEARADWRIEDFDGLAEDLKESYPNLHELREIQAGVTWGPSVPSSASVQEQREGRLMRSNSATVVQLRRGGFTFSKLSPYTTWEEVAGEALRILPSYLEAARPKRLTRAAVRYINDMTLPLAPLRSYLAKPPALASKVPQAMREFLSRVVVWDQKHGATAIIIQAQGAQPELDPMRLLLDIDVIREGDLSTDIVALRQIMESLRALKNRIFFASLTEEAVSHFA